MGILTRLGVKSIPLSIIETAVFFVFTAGYFYGPQAIFPNRWRGNAEVRNAARDKARDAAEQDALQGGATQEEADKAGAKAADAVGPAMVASKSLPVWTWIALGIVYLLIITVWWIPGDEEANRKELIALAIVASATAVAVCAIYWQEVLGVAKTFYDIMATGGGRTSS